MYNTVLKNIRSAERRTRTRAEYRTRQREALEAIVDLPVTIEVEGGGTEDFCRFPLYFDPVQGKILLGVINIIS